MGTSIKLYNTLPGEAGRKAAIKLSGSRNVDLDSAGLGEQRLQKIVDGHFGEMDVSMQDLLLASYLPFHASLHSADGRAPNTEGIQGFLSEVVSKPDGMFRVIDARQSPRTFNPLAAENIGGASMLAVRFVEGGAMHGPIIISIVGLELDKSKDAVDDVAGLIFRNGRDQAKALNDFVKKVEGENPGERIVITGQSIGSKASTIMAAQGYEVLNIEPAPMRTGTIKRMVEIVSPESDLSRKEIAKNVRENTLNIFVPQPNSWNSGRFLPGKDRSGIVFLPDSYSKDGLLDILKDTTIIGEHRASTSVVNAAATEHEELRESKNYEGHGRFFVTEQINGHSKSGYPVGNLAVPIHALKGIVSKIFSGDEDGVKPGEIQQDFSVDDPSLRTR